MLKWQEEQQKALQKQQPKKQILLKLDEAATKRYEDENCQSEVLNSPSSLYVLDISKDTALAIQKRYGVVCVSGENPDVSPLLDVDDYFKPIPGEKNTTAGTRCWTMWKSYPQTPFSLPIVIYSLPEIRNLAKVLEILRGY